MFDERTIGNSGGSELTFTVQRLVAVVDRRALVKRISLASVTG